MPIHAKMELLDSAAISKSVLLSVFLISVKEANIQPFVQASDLRASLEPSFANSEPIQHMLSLYLYNTSYINPFSSFLSPPLLGHHHLYPGP